MFGLKHITYNYINMVVLTLIFFFFSLVASSDFPKVAVSCWDLGHINTMLCIRVSLPIIADDFLKENYEKEDMLNIQTV